MLDYLLLLGRVVHTLGTDGHLAELRDSKLAILLAVLSFLNGEKRCTAASVKTIAERAGIPDSTVYRALNDLVECGFLSSENKCYGLGHRLEAAVQAHERRARPVTNNSSVLEQSSINSDSSVGLTEPQLRASQRKRTGVGDIRQLVLRYGSEHVDKAVLEMEAQYPSDELVRASFGALLRRACENNWVSQKRDDVIKREQEAVQAAVACPETATALVDPDGVSYPILRRVDGFVVIQAGVDKAGVPREAMVPARDWPLFTWATG